MTSYSGMCLNNYLDRKTSIFILRPRARPRDRKSHLHRVFQVNWFLLHFSVLIFLYGWRSSLFCLFFFIGAVLTAGVAAKLEIVDPRLCGGVIYSFFPGVIIPLSPEDLSQYRRKLLIDVCRLEELRRRKPSISAVAPSSSAPGRELIAADFHMIPPPSVFGFFTSLETNHPFRRDKESPPWNAAPVRDHPLGDRRSAPGGLSTYSLSLSACTDHSPEWSSGNVLVSDWIFICYTYYIWGHFDKLGIVKWDAMDCWRFPNRRSEVRLSPYFTSVIILLKFIPVQWSRTPDCTLHWDRDEFYII